jgi:hypothetical protein
MVGIGYGSIFVSQPKYPFMLLVSLRLALRCNVTNLLILILEAEFGGVSYRWVGIAGVLSITPAYPNLHMKM